jgi:hypothetical protein
MSKTAQLELPLILPAQAQKHVTVNEALARLDAVAQLRVITSTLSTPPASAQDGASYLVPAGAVGDWSGSDGRIAVRANGGWVFLAPRAGWRAWDESRAGPLVHDGSGWVADATVVSPGGAGTVARIVEFDHDFFAGTSNTTSVTIPTHSQVLGVTGRVLAAVSGAGVTGWKVGVSGSADRYGSGLGLGVNSYLSGLSGSPITYYARTPLVLTAEGGTFASGKVRIAIHLLSLEPPRPI